MPEWIVKRLKLLYQIYYCTNNSNHTKIEKGEENK